MHRGFHLQRAVLNTNRPRRNYAEAGKHWVNRAAAQPIQKLDAVTLTSVR
jgi:hypothetical protein